MTGGIGTVRAGLVGCGAIAQIMHLPGLQAMQEMGLVELVAVCDVRGEQARASAARFGVPAAFDDLDRMLDEADLSVLVNCTPIPNHFAVTLAGLRAGCHVYTQKPMAATVAEATILIEEACTRGLLLGCAPEHPVRPYIRTIRRLIDEGAIGAVTFARVQSSHGGPEKHDVARDPTWFYKPGSSPILDMGVHGLSQITAILGPVRRLACMSGRTQDARLTTAGAFRGLRIEVEIEDNAHFLLDFDGAHFAHLDATYCVEATLGPRLEVHGTEGTLAVTGPRFAESTLHLYRTADREWREVRLPEGPPVVDLGVWHLVECLHEGSELTLTPERGRHLVEVLTAAPLAATAGRTLAMQTSF
jgi:predicted dehydrogenase